MTGVYSELKKKPQILLTSNIVPVDTLKLNYTFNYKTLYENVQGDNVGVLLIALLKSIGVDKIIIAGMDGFDESNLDDSFFDPNMRFDSIDNANQLLIEQLRRISGTDDIRWLTPSKIKAALQGNGCIIV
jgi:hypothetical protein